MTISIHEEYAELMKANGEGHYLYKPQRFSKLHPGAIGFFDGYGAWNLITDLSEPGRPEKDGYTSLGRDLSYDEPTSDFWRTRSSGSEAESSFGVTGGLSGALTAAPVDVSVEAKNKWGKTGKAALVTDDSVVVNEFLKAPCRTPIQDWVKKNAKALVKGEWGDEIKDYGLWAIQKTWSTQECAITMESAHSRDTSAGLDVGATGIGKIGGSGSSLSKANSKGWTTYKATESDKALVVSYGGSGYRLHKIQIFRSNNPLKQVESRAEESLEYCKAIFDENGNQIGVEYFRPVFDENGKEIGEQKIDKEAEEKARQEEQKRLAEEQDAQADDDFIVESGDTVGETESEAEAEKEAARALEAERKEFAKKVAVIVAQNPDETQRRAQLAKLLAASATTVTTTVPTTTTQVMV